MSKIYLGLVHYPMYNKNREVIATAITNFDIHDIARTARTYDVEKYFLIHPLEQQKDIAREILSYWQVGFGKEYNPDRNDALSIIELADDIEQTIKKITDLEGVRPIVATTDAREYPNTVGYHELRDKVETGARPLLLLFGTGWGIEEKVMASFDYILEPIYGVGEYNHLCVRSAVAIILDRLVGRKWWK